MAPLLALLLCAAPDARPRVYDRVLATVDSEVVTFSRLEFEARVELVRLWPKGDEADPRPMDPSVALGPMPQGFLVSALTQAIASRLAAREAARLANDVDPGALDNALAEFK